MKKMISLFAVVGLLAHISAYAADLSEAELQEQTRLMQEGERLDTARLRKGTAKGAAKGAFYGAGIGGIYKALPEEEDDPLSLENKGDIAIGVAGGAGAGAAVGAALGAAQVAISMALKSGLRMWQVRKINNVLKERTTLDGFATLPQGQAMLFVAAYKRNVPMVKLLVNRLSDFVNQEGVWKALTELFFNETPTSVRVKRLQKLIAE